MEGINLEMCHCLNTNPDRKLMRRKRRAMDAERYQALKDQVDKLLANDFIKEFFLPFLVCKSCVCEEA